MINMALDSIIGFKPKMAVVTWDTFSTGIIFSRIKLKFLFRIINNPKIYLNFGD